MLVATSPYWRESIPARSGNDDVAGEAPATRDAKGASPPAPAPAAGAIAEEQLSLAVVTQLVAKDAEIADLGAQVAKPYNLLVAAGAEYLFHVHGL